MGKVVVLHGFDQEQISLVLKAVKQAVDDPHGIAFATTTPTNLGWKTSELIEHVVEEHEEMKKLNRKA
jgi:hypothetical protein